MSANMSPIEQQQAAQLAAQQSQLLQQKQSLDQAQAHIAHLQKQAAAAAAASPSSSSSPPSSSSPLPLPSRNPEMQPLRPNSFSGATGSNADQWIIEIERYFAAARCQKDRSSVLLASTYLKDSASVWFNAKYKDLVVPETWLEFREAFLERFRPFAATRTARASLRNLRHQGKVAGYSDAFLGLIQHIPEMHMDDQVDAYINGLQAHIAEKVDREDPQTLDEAINLAQREELRQSGRRGQRVPFYSGERRNFIPSNRGRNLPFSSSQNSSSAHDPNRMDLSHIRHSAPSFDPQLSHSSSSSSLSPSSSAGVNPSGSAPVFYSQSDLEQAYEQGLNAIHQRPSAPFRKQPNDTRVPNLSQAEFDRCSKAGLCFQCGQGGHLARNCPKNTRGSSRSLNY